jgi:glycerophosphoryl diester phosphodiesterase
MTLRLGHRGDHTARHGAAEHLENTLGALLAAAQRPDCDGVEFDVRLSADGVPVLHHDESLERVHGLPVAVAATPARTLEELGVARLEDVLAALPRRSFIDVEIKVPIGRAGVEVLAAARGPELRRAVVSSFAADALRQMRHLAPTWPLWLNAEDLSAATIGLASRLDCVAISVDWRAIDPGSMARARAAGLDVAAWTVTRRPTYRRLVGLGVVAICAEGPALASGSEGARDRTARDPSVAADGRVA